MNLSLDQLLTPTPKEVALIKQCLMEGTHPAGRLRNFGMAYPLSWETLHLGMIHLKTLEEQAQYADLVTQAAGQDADLFPLLGFDPADLDAVPFKQFNLTTLGNCAFMALHAPRPEHRQKCKEKVEAYIQWRVSP